MKTTRVYDLPIRFFHWTFAFLFVLAYLIAEWIDDESPWFTYHMIAGLLFGLAILFRLFWGWFGSSVARFRLLPLSFFDLIRYAKEVITKDPPTDAGHHPASSWLLLVMLATGMILVSTGLSMFYGLESDWSEEIHEWAATLFLMLVGIHLLGLITHGFRHRDGNVFAMIHGKKQYSSVIPVNDIPRSTGIGWSYLLILAIAAAFLVFNVDFFRPE